MANKKLIYTPEGSITAESAPFFSIITATLNSEKYLEETLESVRSQSFPSWEQIIVDGGSKDGTLTILKNYENSLHFISESDNGIAEAMNKGVALAKGKVVAFLHSDDRYLPDTLKKVYQAFSLHPEKRWLIGNGEYIDETGCFIKDVRLKRFCYKALQRLNFIFHPSVFIEKIFFEKTGGFDTRLRYAMDYDLWLRMGKLSDPIQIFDCLSSFRLHEGSLSIRQNLEAFDEEYAIRQKAVEKTPTEQFLAYFHYRVLRLIKKFGNVQKLWHVIK